MLLDIGDYFIYSETFFNLDSVKVNFHLVQISKYNYLPKDKIQGIKYYEQRADAKEHYEGWVLIHFLNSIVCHSLEKFEKFETHKMMFDVEELCFISTSILFIYKKNTRKVYLIYYPFEFNSSINKHLIYESQSLIKRFVALGYYYYIVEENKFVKRLYLDYINGRYGKYPDLIFVIYI